MPCPLFELWLLLFSIVCVLGKKVLIFHRAKPYAILEMPPNSIFFGGLCHFISGFPLKWPHVLSTDFRWILFFLSFVCGAGGNGPPDDNSQWSVDRRETSRAHIYYENVINAKDRRYKSYKIWFMIMFTCDPYRRATQTMPVLGNRVCFLFFSSHTM